jgi:hypothetical protein
MALAAVFLMAGAGIAAAQDASTPAEAKALVETAVAHWDDVGRDQALKDFNSGESPWIEHDLYVMVLDEQGTFLAHANPGLRNQDGWDLQDINGVFIIRDMVAAGAESDAGGWSNYVWMNPATNRQDQKWTWNQEHDGVFFGVGAYGQNPEN